MLLNGLYTYTMSERIKEIDSTISGISKTGRIVVICVVIISLFLFVFCSYNEVAKDILSNFWKVYWEKISIIALLWFIILIMLDIKIILKFIKEKLW